jgi:hypothetical protein
MNHLSTLGDFDKLLIKISNLPHVGHVGMLRVQAIFSKLQVNGLIKRNACHKFSFI